MEGIHLSTSLQHRAKLLGLHLGSAVFHSFGFCSSPTLPFPLLSQMNIFHRAGTPSRETNRPPQMSETKAAEEDAAVMPYKLLTTDDDDGDGDSGIGEKKMQSGSPTLTTKHWLHTFY